jgi:hypothetical protein
MDCGEFLQTSHAAEPEHGQLPPSERKVRALDPVVEPATCLLAICRPYLFQRRTPGREPVDDDRLWLPMLAHCFPEEFPRCLLVSGLRDETREHFALMVDGPPKVMLFAVDLHEHLVEVPSPTAGLHPFDPPFSDLGGKHQAEPVPPEKNCLVADLHAALVQQILDVPK